ncbi:MAG: hypothetical protein HS127_15815 [Planctomycetia bacterium]|nr:hypothetical protein [Planctomycetia bacterium]
MGIHFFPELATKAAGLELQSPPHLKEVNCEIERRKWALFWCNLLHPVIFGEIEKEQTNLFLKNSAFRSYSPTESGKDHYLYPQEKTQPLPQRWISISCKKARSDRGASEGFLVKLSTKPLNSKKNNHAAATIASTAFLRNTMGKRSPNPPSTAISDSQGRPGSNSASHSKRCVYALSREHTHDLWIGDFQEGPFVLVDGEALPTNLCLFIDCYSRYVVEGRYYLKQTLDIISILSSGPGLSTARPKNSTSTMPRSTTLTPCALPVTTSALNSSTDHHATLLGGLVERFFGTSQTQFESEVRSGDIITLDAINQAFSAYLAVVYHARIHSKPINLQNNATTRGLPSSDTSIWTPLLPSS